ncbi:MAG: arginase family protein [Clostridia bacterium]|nr:arginase family protein [Clostridia bacterium]
MKIRVVGIPSNIGALYSGTELGPSMLREANLIEVLGQNHIVLDEGDVVIPSNLVRHNEGAIRNWPSPKVVWNLSQAFLEHSFNEDEFTLILGGGCSVFTGIFMRFHEKYQNSAKIVTIDHHIDIRKPENNLCMGATAYTLWFLTQNNPWIEKPKDFMSSSICAMGYSADSLDEHYDVKELIKYPMTEVSENPVKVATSYLNMLEATSMVMLHLDLDVLMKEEMASVYMPSEQGLSFKNLFLLLKTLIRDPRVKGLVVTEFSGNNGDALIDAKKVVDLLEKVFRP